MSLKNSLFDDLSFELKKKLYTSDIKFKKYDKFTGGGKKETELAQIVLAKGDIKWATIFKKFTLKNIFTGILSKLFPYPTSFVCDTFLTEFLTLCIILLILGTTEYFQKGSIKHLFDLLVSPSNADKFLTELNHYTTNFSYLFDPTKEGSLKNILDIIIKSMPDYVTKYIFVKAEETVADVSLYSKLFDLVSFATKVRDSKETMENFIKNDAYLRNSFIYQVFRILHGIICYVLSQLPSWSSYTKKKESKEDDVDDEVEEEVAYEYYGLKK